MSRDDLIDLGLLALAAASLAGAFLLRDYCKPVPAYRRVLMRVGLA